MARAKRHYLRGHVWHITHRCHKKEFVLKFIKDRQSKWTQSLAVGDKSFLEMIKGRLGIRAKGRRIKENGDTYQLREPIVAYGQWHQIATDNRFYWDVAT